MGLTLVTGLANTGKTGRVYEAVERAVAAGRSAVVLLPTGPDVVRTRREFAERCPVGVGVDRFSAYVDARWSLLGDGRDMIAPVQRVALLERAVEKAPLGALAASASKPGFTAAFAPVLARLAEYDRDSLSASNDIDADILKILDRYEALAAGAGLVERGRASLRLTTEPAGAQTVAVHRFADLSPAQEALIGSWSRGGTDVVVSIPWEAEAPATSALDPQVARLLPGATHVHLPRTAADDELAWFEAALFMRGPARRPGGSVIFATAAGEEAECALAAERVESLLLGDGVAEPVPPDRIAVVFRDPSRRIVGLTTAFASRGIPFDLDVNVGISRTPLGAAVCQLIGFCVDPTRRDLLAGLLRGPFCDAEPAEVDRAEVAWRRRRETGAAELIRCASALGPGTSRILALGRRLTDAPLAAGQETFKTLLDLMVSCSWTGVGLGSTQGAADAARAHGSLVKVVEQLAALGDHAPSPARLPGLLRTLPTSAGTTRQGRVQITEAHRLRGRRFDAVVVGGLTADEFSSQDRSGLPSLVTERLTGIPSPSDRAMERLLFYQVVTRARRRLELVRLVADSRGIARRPSVFWEEAIDLFRTPDDDAAEANDAVVADLSIAAADRGAPMVTGDRRRLRAGARARSRTRPVPMTGPTPALADEDLLERLARRDEFSVTELETYARCPYRWFLERAVSPGRLDQEVDARVAGLLVHEVLRRTYELLKDATGDARVTAATLDAAKRLVEEVFDEVLAQQPVTPASLGEEDLIASARSRAAASLETDAQRPGAFDVAELEFGFGAASARPVTVAGVPIRGRIDRIDRDGDRLVVIDYKWGSGTPNAKFEERGVVQLPLYAAVAEQLLGGRCVAGLYRGLGAGESRGWWVGVPADRHADLVSTDAVTEERAREIVEKATDRAAEAAAGIRAGRIGPAQRASERCRTCSAVAHCPGGSG